LITSLFVVIAMGFDDPAPVRIQRKLCFATAMMLILMLMLAPSSSARAHAAAATPPQLPVAIIGAGIAGAATAFFASNFSAAPIDFHVFESRDYIGGRLKHFQVEDLTLELGGDAWADVNQYVSAAASFLGLPVGGQSSAAGRRVRFFPRESVQLGSGDAPPDLGIWTGRSFVNLSELLANDSKSEGVAAAQLLEFLARLAKNYQLRDHAMPNRGAFDTIEEFLAPGGLDVYTNITASSFFSAAGVSPDFAFLSLEPLQRTIYDQLLSHTQAFPTLTSLTAMTSAHWVKTGNSALVQAMFAYANASVHLNTTVTTVVANSDGTFTVAYTNRSGAFSLQARAVVLAAPFEHAHIEFLGFTLPPLPPRLWVKWFVTIVGSTGGVNPAYFGLSDPSQLPDDIFTTENSTVDTPFSSLQTIGVTASGVIVHKIFSNSDVSGILSELFEGLQWFRVQDWPYTFPALVPVPEPTDPSVAFQPVVLWPSLYYTDGIESVASAMECSAIAGRNIALHLTAQ